MKWKSRWIARSCAFLCLISVALSASAQKKLTGKIVDSKGQPVAGATVTVKGTTTSTSSLSTGEFAILVPDGKTTVVISSIGFESVEENILNKDFVSVSMAEKTTALNEMVVTGYTTQRKKDLTGAVTVVNVEDMARQPNSQVSNQLQGQASGVTVIGSGQPGEDPQIRIRGINTFGNNTPLYIVDGVATQDISTLNPSDVSSIQVLKDAGSASIYGARASNGVIIITTKKGKTGKPVVAFDAYYGVQVPKSGNVFNMLNPQEQAQLKYDANANSGTPITSDPMYGNGTTPVLPDYIAPIGAMNGDPSVDPSLYFINPNYTNPADLQTFYHIVKADKTGTDWFHSVVKNAPIQNYNLNVSGGSENAHYMMSANYFDQQGVLSQTYEKRLSVRANTSFNVSKNIVVGETMAYTITENPQITALNGGSPIAFTFRSQTIIPVYDIKGNYAAGYGQGLGDSPNPVAVQDRTANNKTLANRLIGSVYADVTFLKNFTFHTSFGGDSYADNSHSFTYPTYENQENTTSNSYSESSDYNSSWTWTNTLSYKKLFADVHSVQLLVGTEAYEANFESLGGTTYDYLSFNPNYTTLTTGSGVQTNFSSRSAESLQSYFARLDYSFKDRYLLSATIRRDGSSRFTAVNRYGVFPAVSAGWRISQESFMGSVDWVSDLKIRGGWGIMGNQFNLNTDNAFNTFTSNRNSSFYDLAGTNNSIEQGFQVGQIGNPDAKWEKDANTNIGVDASLFKGILNITFDWYQKNITDLLFNPELPGTYGRGVVPYQNIASMSNRGVDFTVSAAKSISKDLKINATFSFTSFNNKVTKVTDNTNYFYSGDARDFGTYFVKNQVGHPVGAFYGYNITGFWQNQAEIDNADAAAKKATNNVDAIFQVDEGVGRFKYQDVNGDGQIDDNDRTFIGNPNPKFNYGLDLGVQYKNFDFSVFFYGVNGNQIWNQTLWWTDFYASFSGGKSKTALYNSWSTTNPNAKAPLQEVNGWQSTNLAPNSYYIENGSYLRCKNMMLGYTFSGSAMQKLHISTFRLYIQAANLFTSTKYSGYDPEINGTGVTQFGIDEGAYPSTKQWLVGVNLKF